MTRKHRKSFRAREPRLTIEELDFWWKYDVCLNVMKIIWDGVWPNGFHYWGA